MFFLYCNSLPPFHHSYKLHTAIALDGQEKHKRWNLLGLDMTIIVWLGHVQRLRLVFRIGCKVVGLLLWFNHRNVVGQWTFWSGLASWVPWKHDLDLNSQDSLTQQDVTSGSVDVIVARITRVDHQTINELHGLGTLTTELSGNDNFATLGARLHDEAEDTIAGATNGQTSDELVTE